MTITKNRKNSWGKSKTSLSKFRKYSTGLIFVSLAIYIIIVGSRFNSLDSYSSDPIFDNEIHVKAAATTTVKVFLNDTDHTHTQRGQSFTYSGYTQKFSVTPSIGFHNTSNIPVYPIINGVHYDGIEVPGDNRTIRSGAEGYFEFTVSVPSSWDYQQDLEVWANITEISTENIFVGSITPQNLTGTNLPIYHDITATASFTSIDFKDSEGNYDEGPFLVDDQYYIEYYLEDELGNPLQSNTISVFRNRDLNDELANYTTPDTDTNVDGRGFFLFTQPDNTSSVGVHFEGNGYTVDKNGDPFYQVIGTSIYNDTQRVEVVNSDITYSNTDNSTVDNVFTGGNVQLNGSLWANNDITDALGNVDFSVFTGDGDLVYSGTTDANGDFSFDLNLDDIGHSSNDSLDLIISVDSIDSALKEGDSGTLPVWEQTNTTETVSLTFEDPPSTAAAVNNTGIQDPQKDWSNLILPGAIVIGIIVFIVIFQRFNMQKQVNQDFKLRKVDYTRFAIINLLYNQDRKREAIAYTYKIFADLINEKYGLRREANQTLREYGMECVTRYGLDPLRTYPFISMVENIIYGAFDLNQRSFQKSISIFGRIFQEITGTSLDFTMEMSTTDETEVTLKIGAVQT